MTRRKRNAHKKNTNTKNKKNQNKKRPQQQPTSPNSVERTTLQPRQTTRRHNSSTLCCRSHRARFSAMATGLSSMPEVASREHRQSVSQKLGATYDGYHPGDKGPSTNEGDMRGMIMREKERIMNQEREEKAVALLEEMQQIEKIIAPQLLNLAEKHAVAKQKVKKECAQTEHKEKDDRREVVNVKQVKRAKTELESAIKHALAVKAANGFKEIRKADFDKLTENGEKAQKAFTGLDDEKQRLENEIRELQDELKKCSKERGEMNQREIAKKLLQDKEEQRRRPEAEQEGAEKVSSQLKTEPEKQAVTVQELQAKNAALEKQLKKTELQEAKKLGDQLESEKQKVQELEARNAELEKAEAELQEAKELSSQELESEKQKIQELEARTAELEKAEALSRQELESEKHKVQQLETKDTATEEETQVASENSEKCGSSSCGNGNRNLRGSSEATSSKLMQHPELGGK
ncbi:unnamed protein product [Amoebophrya sp. A25]|nr:unnamed protein product [Amoebophrya sp. A25]|eukprot:GSA25T00016800001.1